MTTKFKGEILLNNIYGIDVDRNAVEVTKLSLLLKCLEGESKESLKAQMTLFQQKVLPTIDENIVSGNSLVDFDIYGLSPNLEADLQLKRKINAFSWQTHFKSIFKESGGFHVIIGNPPYVEQSLFKELKDYLKQFYSNYDKTADLYVYFFEKSYNLLSKDGLFSIIVANKWFRTKYAKQLRKWLLKTNIEYIKDFGDLSVFKNATTYPCIIKINKQIASDSFHFVDLVRLGIKDPALHNQASFTSIKKSNLSDDGWILEDSNTLTILSNIKKNAQTLDSYTCGKIFRGIITGLNDAFVFSNEKAVSIYEQKSNYKELFVPFLQGRDVKAFNSLTTNDMLLFLPKGWTKNRYGNLTEENCFKKFSKEFPLITDHLKPFEAVARDRWDQGDFWWELRACDYYDDFKTSKIIYPNILQRPEFTFDEKGFFTNQKCYIIAVNDLFLLGILNSDLSYFWFEMYLPKLRGGFYEPNHVIFKNFPICKIDPKQKEMVQEKEKVIKNVEKLLKLTSKNKDKEAQKECLYLKNEINKSVYKLYGIKKSESDHIMEILENVKRK